ncbi:MAG TPA: PaaI family thioesterase [Firmicutes bacterium]|nr:PaaI family thioesterase [Bacillota bacterium]
MKDRENIPREGNKVSFRDDGCFVCGPNNPIGLKLKFEYDRDNKRATSKVTFRKEHQGWDGVVHGGLLAAVLDDVMAHSVLCTDNLAITTRFNIIYRSPVGTGETVYLEGQVVEMKSRLAKVTGVAYTLNGEKDGRREIKCEAEAYYYLDSPGREKPGDTQTT